MQSVVVSGRFVNGDDPVEGTISFRPSKIWVDDDDGLSYPTLAPEVELEDGNFIVRLTRTDQTELPWYYTMNSPVGRWTIRITEDGPISLRDLLPKRFSA